VKHYSFNADLTSVFQRLAARRPAGPTLVARNDAASETKTNSLEYGALQPRMEIADVTLRQSRDDTRDAVT
jgi:hypothetical protein